MSDLTITEALAEIRMIDKKVETKRQFVLDYATNHPERIDPLGDSTARLRSEMQAIADLAKRHMDLRDGINAANRKTKLKVNDNETSIHEWLIWRREIAPNHLHFLRRLMAKCRQDKTDMATGRPVEVQCHVDVSDIQRQIEDIESILETLDGQLSLLNAKTFI